MSNPKMNVTKLSNEDLQDMFTEVYEKNVAAANMFDSFECICKRDSNNPDIMMEVTITGMAGSPTIDDYKNGKVKNCGSVVINREGKGSLKFKLVPSDTISLNTNDYMVVYKAE